MRIETSEILNRELDSHRYSVDDKVYNLDRLLNIFLKCENKTTDDVLNFKTGMFLMFIRANVHKIKGASESVLQEYFETSVKAYMDKVNAVRYSKYSVENFARIIGSTFGDKKKALLDVGAGEIPYSTLLLAHKFKSATAMDYMGKSLPYFKNFGVHFKKEIFDSNTDVSPYDVVVGRKPCSAIEHIVSKGASEHKPYFIEICDCSFPDLTQNELLSYLSSKDKNLRVVTTDYSKGILKYFLKGKSTYVHNLDMEEAEIKKKINDSHNTLQDFLMCEPLPLERGE